MKVLFIGGTGFISSAVSRQAVEMGFELWILNRGLRSAQIPGTHILVADIHNPQSMQAALKNMAFDVVVDWIAYTPEDIERDIKFFRGKTNQFIFISSASAYKKPSTHYLITESTPLENPYWDYSRNKIACEERLMKAFHEEDFPVTIVRPSLTYDPNFPIAIGGWGCYTLADRLKKGLPIIVHGDGTSLWVVTHAEDFGRGFLGLLGKEHAIGEAFHITTDEVQTWDQIYQKIAVAMDVEANIVHIPSEFIVKIAPQMTGSLFGDKMWSSVFDNSKIKSFVPEFQASIPFSIGMRRTVAWFESDQRRQLIDEGVNAEMDKILKAYRYSE
jgi:nucleoside-diphosphate-sugar epimerase